MTKASDNPYPSILIEEATEPTAPAAGHQRVYIDSTSHHLSRTDSSGTAVDLESGGGSTPDSDAFKRTTAHYTSASTSFVDVDGTNLALSITTGANRVLVGFVGTVENSNANGYVYLDVDVDGSRVGGTDGLVIIRTASAGHHANGSFTFLTDALTAASHTFKLQWKTAAGTMTMRGGGAAPTSYCQFYVVEIA